MGSYRSLKVCCEDRNLLGQRGGYRQNVMTITSEQFALVAKCLWPGGTSLQVCPTAPLRTACGALF